MMKNIYVYIYILVRARYGLYHGVIDIKSLTEIQTAKKHYSHI